MMETVAAYLQGRGVRRPKSDFLTRFEDGNSAWEAVKNSDLQEIVDPQAPSLPWEGVRLLQVEDIVTISSTDPREDMKPGPSRTLSLALSDGVDKYTAVELECLPQLSIKTLPGTKLLLMSPVKKRGLLMLTPDSVQVLDGFVDSIADRQRNNVPENMENTGRLDLGNIAAISDDDENSDELLLEAAQRVEDNGP